jgi:hypothetical protein
VASPAPAIGSTAHHRGTRAPGPPPRAR